MKEEDFVKKGLTDENEFTQQIILYLKMIAKEGVPKKKLND